MKVYAVSDLHVDYPENLAWVKSLALQGYSYDVLIVAGDISNELALLEDVLGSLRDAFFAVCYVPGNHELWLTDGDRGDSMDKFEQVLKLCEKLGVRTDTLELEGLDIVPLFSWYDLSFGDPDRHLLRGWRDFHHCRWPEPLHSPADICRHFLGLNKPRLANCAGRNPAQQTISFSHFLPRIDLMPRRIPRRRQVVYPVLGAQALETQLRQLMPDLHVYGHSHVNQLIELDGVCYVNNALAYPRESRIARRELLCVYDRQSQGGVLAAGAAA